MFTVLIAKNLSIFNCAIEESYGEISTSTRDKSIEINDKDDDIAQDLLARAGYCVYMTLAAELDEANQSL
ncbi:MAG: hypothetical protein ACRCWP_05680 [Shewanella sp.]